VALLLLCLGYTYAPALETMATKWNADPQYSHGWLVIPFAAFLLWMRRGEMPATLGQANIFGLVVLLFATALRLAGAWVYFDWAEAISFPLALAGVVLLIGGGPLLRWAWPALAFLLFMVPLPHRVETALGGTLQQIATHSCATVLQTLGRPAAVNGNTLTIQGSQVEVVPACSGLGSLLVFFGMAAALGMLGRRPLVDRVVLLVSAIPIALVANVVRIVMTVLLHEQFGAWGSYDTYHELAGWVMMVLALLLLWGELALLRMIFVETPDAGPTPCDATST